MSRRRSLMWSVDPQVEAARALSGWAEFMRLCGRQRLFIEAIHRRDDGAGYSATAYTVRPVKNSDCHAHQPLAVGSGLTVVDAVLDAVARSGVTVDLPATMILTG
jgi:hypothetical protein